ncbi:hypothetical protein [Bradyrhizobium prioriisuperbiae]|uniref:hypothetical protein n=1 Tax=Bradyrhizobium prioriisuperbiae TaxID=2854389 RepID=UPI0028E4F29F|nr:hypothetical protein [Bradyrhizobium prioritasuperba]
MIWAILILPGLVVAYALFVRPMLHAIPALKSFYDEADGFWAKVWALCGRSVTVVWGLALQGIGQLLQWIDPIASALGDPDLRAQITETLGANPKILGYVLMFISVVTLAARFRGIARDAE